VQRLAARCDLPSDKRSTQGAKLTWRWAARSEPPGGLGRFRLVVPRLRQTITPLSMVVCVMF